MGKKYCGLYESSGKLPVLFERITKIIEIDENLFTKDRLVPKKLLEKKIYFDDSFMNWVREIFLKRNALVLEIGERRIFLLMKKKPVSKGYLAMRDYISGNQQVVKEHKIKRMAESRIAEGNWEKYLKYKIEFFQQAIIKAIKEKNK
jgi:hypothetical protein